jgi:hypothetical protein
MTAIARFSKEGFVIHLADTEFVMLLLQSARSIISQINSMKLYPDNDYFSWDLPLRIRGLEAQVLLLYEAIPFLADHRTTSVIAETHQITLINSALSEYQEFKIKMLKKEVFKSGLKKVFRQIDWTNRNNLFHT